MKPQATAESILLRRRRIQRGMYFVALASFVIPVVFLIFRMIFGKETPVSRTDADYALMITQCALGIFAIHIPMLLAHGFRFDVPQTLYLLYLLFLYCSIFLGEVQGFYYRVPHWDVILHSFSSMMAGFFGTMVVTILNRDERTISKLSPRFVGVFAFCFAFAVGALWEIYEYILDGLFGYNMQKFLLADGTPLVGHAALNDTMKDLIVDGVGALIASIVGVISLKKGKRWFVPSLTENSAKPAAEKPAPVPAMYAEKARSVSSGTSASGFEVKDIVPPIESVRK